MCVRSREADSSVLPQQCDISSGHDAFQPGQRLLLEERVWQGPQMSASGNYGNSIHLFIIMMFLFVFSPQKRLNDSPVTHSSKSRCI